MDDLVKIRVYIRQNQANAPLYTLKHVFPAVRIGRELASLFPADPLIVEAGLLLHDIGYHKTYESKERDHIVRGMKIAKTFLYESGFPRNLIDPVVDTIRTHDGRLEKDSPVENFLVNDADQVAVFTELPWMYQLMRSAFGMSHERALSGCLQEAWKSYHQVISSDWVRNKFVEDYELTKQWLREQVSRVPREDLLRNPPRENVPETFQFLEEILSS